MMTITVSTANTYFKSFERVLFNGNMSLLIQFPCGAGPSYTIPDSVTSINSWAFGFCENLVSVIIPDSVTVIGEFAFYRCKSLSYVAFLGNRAPSCGTYPFDYTAASIVHVNADYSGRYVCDRSVVGDYVAVSDVFSHAWFLASMARSAGFGSSILFKFRIIYALS